MQVSRRSFFGALASPILTKYASIPGDPNRVRVTEYWPKDNPVLHFADESLALSMKEFQRIYFDPALKLFADELDRQALEDYAFLSGDRWKIARHFDPKRLPT